MFRQDFQHFNIKKDADPKIKAPSSYFCFTEIDSDFLNLNRTDVSNTL